MGQGRLVDVVIMTLSYFTKGLDADGEFFAVHGIGGFWGDEALYLAASARDSLTHTDENPWGCLTWPKTGGVRFYRAVNGENRRASEISARNRSNRPINGVGAGVILPDFSAVDRPELK